MAVASIKELIEKKEALEAKKRQTFELETSIGTIVAKKISRTLFMEAIDMENGEGDRYLIVNAVIEPKLTDAQLLQAYNCAEPTDIVDKLFDPGEIPAIARAIMDCAGFGKKISHSLHEEIKN